MDRDLRVRTPFRRASGSAEARPPTLPKHDLASHKSCVLVGESRQAPIAAAVRDLCNRTAITVQAASAVTTFGLSAIRPGTSSAASSSAPLSAATLASVGCQAGGIGRDHHPGPRALPRPPWPWSRAPRSALPSMAMTSPSPLPSRAGQRRDPGQHPTEDRTQRLLIDHPEHRRIDVMQRYRLPKLQ